MLAGTGSFLYQSRQPSLPKQQLANIQATGLASVTLRLASKRQLHQLSANDRMLYSLSISTSIVFGILLTRVITWAYDCASFENDPMGTYLQVKDIDTALPNGYKDSIDRSYYRRLALSQPCLQTDPTVKIPIVGSGEVEPRVLASASSILSMLNASATHMRRLVEQKTYVVVVPVGKSPCDLPETKAAACDPNLGGANLKRDGSLVVIVRAESVLCRKLNGFSQHGGILIHELTHAIENANRLQSRTYDAYIKAYWKNLWRRTYIDKGPIEYLPVGAEIYFGLPLNVAYEWPVRTKERLRSYDSNLYSLLFEIFGEHPLIDGSRICLYICD